MRVHALFIAVAAVAGCATDYTPPPPVGKPGPEYSDTQAYQPHRGPGLFGDLTWYFSMPGKGADPKPAPIKTSEEEDFKKWRESMSPSERQEFDDWRAWQEWKRKNPK